MKKIAIIACDNGLGHIRRCYIIGLELASFGIAVDLFSPKKSFEKFKDLYGANYLLNNVDFSTGTSSTALRASDAFCLKWYSRLPDLSIYNKVISDNLPEILNIRPDSILSGHFFWHEDLDSVSENYKQDCRKLIKDCNPVIIGSELFASEGIRANSNFNPVGLYIFGETYLDTFEKDALLITGGATTALMEELKELVQFFITNGPGLFNKVYVDSSLLTSKDNNLNLKNLPDWMELATYDVAMFKRISLAICRSGVGTLTDLLQHAGKAYCVYESGNKELEINARRLENSGLGKVIGDPKLIRNMKLAPFTAQDNECLIFHKAIKSLSFDGAKEAAAIILKNLEN